MRLAFGEFALDAEAYELRRSGVPVAVEPRVVEFLAYLIEHRDRVVAKDELLLEVWKGQHVSESALTRCVYEARRALGDDGERQDLVKTVYGRGYQFVGTVGIDSDTSYHTDADAGGVGVHSAPDAVQDPVASSSPLALSRWLLLLPVIVGLVLWFKFDQTSKQVPLEEELPVALASLPGTVERLVIVPFSADDDGPDASLTALSVSDQLWYRLALHPGLVVRGLEVGAALESAGLEPAAMVQEARVDAVLTGQLEAGALGERYQLIVRLHEQGLEGEPRSFPIGTYQIPAFSSRSALQRFVRVRDAIAADVVEHLSPTLISSEAAGISPRDPEALRLYLQARERFATISCGDADVLLDLLDRSLRLDPDFAVAWVAKGFALYSQSWSCGREVAFVDRALEAARRGRELAPELPGAVFLEVTLLVELGRAEEAYALLLEVWDTVGTSPLAHLARAYVLRYAGFLEPAMESVDRALELDPLVLAEFGSAPLSFLYHGDVEGFLERLPAGDVTADRFYRGVALARVGRVEEAHEMLEPAFRLNPADLFARLASSLTAILEGDDATGLEIVRGVVRQRQRLGTVDGEMTFKEAQLLAWAGSGEEALDRLEATLEAGFFCPRCIEDEPAFAPWRDDPRYLELVARAQTRHRAFAVRFSLAPEV
ncbi:MAG: winged helix-turn-helix domain-containing protein [Thermoanaerobaculia bacterium]|nr:winged helix-turn-helix domain-containing protein [Thermoanaerobaculia bacterium]